MNNISKALLKDTVAPVIAGAGIGAALMGAGSYFNNSTKDIKRHPGETDAEYNKRISSARNRNIISSAAVGTILGAGVGSVPIWSRYDRTSTAFADSDVGDILGAVYSNGHSDTSARERAARTQRNIADIKREFAAHAQVHEAKSFFGIHDGMSLSDIKHSVRNKVAQTHPDHNGSEEDMKNVNKYLDILKITGIYKSAGLVKRDNEQGQITPLDYQTLKQNIARYGRDKAIGGYEEELKKELSNDNSRATMAGAGFGAMSGALSGLIALSVSDTFNEGINKALRERGLALKKNVHNPNAAAWLVGGSLIGAGLGGAINNFAARTRGQNEIDNFNALKESINRVK